MFVCQLTRTDRQTIYTVPFFLTDEGIDDGVRDRFHLMLCCRIMGVFIHLFLVVLLLPDVTKCK